MERQRKWSERKIRRQRWIERSNESRRVTFGRLTAIFTTDCDRRDDPDKRAIRTVEPDGIANEIELAPVLAGDDAAVALIPIQDELPIETFLNDVSVHHDFGTRRDPDG